VRERSKGSSVGSRGQQAGSHGSVQSFSAAFPPLPWRDQPLSSGRDEVPDRRARGGMRGWLPGMDSNRHSQVQNSNTHGDQSNSSKVRKFLRSQHSELLTHPGDPFAVSFPTSATWEKGKGANALGSTVGDLRLAEDEWDDERVKAEILAADGHNAACRLRLLPPARPSCCEPRDQGLDP
jgi:hypothetical protein